VGRGRDGGQRHARQGIDFMKLLFGRNFLKSCNNG
jgi:hypothetical protein